MHACVHVQLHSSSAEAAAQPYGQCPDRMEVGLMLQPAHNKQLQHSPRPWCKANGASCLQELPCLAPRFLPSHSLSTAVPCNCTLQLQERSATSTQCWTAANQPPPPPLLLPDNTGTGGPGLNCLTVCCCFTPRSFARYGAPSCTCGQTARQHAAGATRERHVDKQRPTPASTSAPNITTSPRLLFLFFLP